ncbi:hypothetical protein ASPBRDRAFT_49429 [Aspergillus brasiliensis CBS 101740]|uniref:NmrA-like domain-containing protein n=1 Tax=Aspergillus brasiliensis (strain CBS 101740 / IMI 381727 / IBT 21946) TaxID=767769 RepID=A0A1L9U2G2_ASPBC|nr:hypothetical protein ASPBRDRAFT_49429 [Aspergillus brasiliensis CBS 101740]
MSKIIAIIGATGNQGSSVAHTFLNAPNWTVRAITRNPASTKARALAAAGAELFQANLNDIASLEAAFQGVHSIFVNTDFWGPYLSGTGTGGETTRHSDDAFNEEVNHGKNAAIAASRVPTLERFVYSALGPMKRASKGKYAQSYHWDSKATIVDYIKREQPELAKKTSFIYIGVYATNPLFVPKPDPETGFYKFILPMRGETKIPIIDTPSSTGPFVHALVEHEPAGTNLLAYDSYLSLDEVVDIWAKTMGKQAELVTVTAEHMHAEFNIPWEVLQAPLWIDEAGYMGGIDEWIDPADLKVRPRTKTFGEWLAGRDWEGVLDGGHAELQSLKEPGKSA